MPGMTVIRRPVMCIDKIMPRWLAAAILIVAVIFFFPSSFQMVAQGEMALIEVAASERQWTGVAVSKEGRIFVSYPRWSDNVPFSVAELKPDGQAIPFPDREWNTWNASLPAKEHFVCVQNVYVDGGDFLWILDAANPQMTGVVPDGPKLMKVDLKTNQVVQTIYFNEAMSPRDSYLNDVRVDAKKGYAYLTDSGAPALVVVNLSNGEIRRLLSENFSMSSEKIILVINGKQWRRPDGRILQVHVEGIALDRTGQYLYYHALSGRTLYRIDTKWLYDKELPEDKLPRKVEMLGLTGPVEGMEIGPDGNLYLTSIEDNSIKRFARDRKLETVIRDSRLAWPHSIAFGPDGFLYVTTSQRHMWSNPSEPYRIFKFKP